MTVLCVSTEPILLGKHESRILLLADTQTLSSKHRVAWSLKYTLPAPSGTNTTRRFSAIPRGYRPCGFRLWKVQFDTSSHSVTTTTTLLPKLDFLALSDHVTQYEPVRAQSLDLQIPEALQNWLYSGLREFMIEIICICQEIAKWLSLYPWTLLLQRNSHTTICVFASK